ncbi:MAG: putative molybdenum carrier protein [Desulfamplus sp.]|nr:putative molybdenum carrier protein [Desulfamplus sp.]MBF0258064.1 putative molybdenum carrier protein [Desulfamplus sp.]
MLKKIISGGQTGADRAAIDTAIKFNLDHGGWIPAGRRAEDGALSEQYNLIEMETSSYPKRTEQNIINSDGTLIISRGMLAGGSLLTRKIASRLNKPWCHIDLMEMDEFEGAVILHGFVSDNQIEILNVAGPRASQDPFIYRSVKSIIETFIYMELMETSPDELRADDIILFQRKPEFLCTTIEDAVTFLADTMQLRTRSVIANSSDIQIGSLYFSLSDTIKVKLGLDSGNTELLDACRKNLEIKKGEQFQYRDGEAFSGDIMDIEDAAMVILKELKKFLKKSHILRVVN